MNNSTLPLRRPITPAQARRLSRRTLGLQIAEAVHYLPGIKASVLADLLSRSTAEIWYAADVRSRTLIDFGSFDRQAATDRVRRPAFGEVPQARPTKRRDAAPRDEETRHQARVQNTRDLPRAEGISASSLHAPPTVPLDGSARRIVPGTRATRVWSNDDILAALELAAEIVDGRLSRNAYESVRRAHGLPSASLVIKRFGKWQDACNKAGVRAGKPRRAGYQRTWTLEEIVEQVAVYLTRPGVSSTFAGYSQWARGESTAPSGSTVLVRLGPWTGAKAAARRLIAVGPVATGGPWARAA